MTKDVEKVVTILKLLQDARNIDKKYNALPAIIANRNMFISVWCGGGIKNVTGDTTFVRIYYEDYAYEIALSYQDMYYEGFDSMKARSSIQRAINTLVYQAQQAQHPTGKL